MENFNSYGFIIIVSIIIIISYLFNIFSRKTNIPSVLMLIGLGILIQEIMVIFQIRNFNFLPVLEVFGIIGLILIVLEAALDIELRHDKRRFIEKAMLIALITLLISSITIAFLLQYFFTIDFINALIYAIPLSIMSSAIVIPSVTNLTEEKKEFMVFESSFSDILGIMFFYFLIGNIDANSIGEVIFSVSKDVFLTFIVSIVFSYSLIILFQKIKTPIKLFLLISVLVLLYSIGKLLQLSSLLIILVFGLILENRHLFFRGRLQKLINEKYLASIYDNLKMITLESSFVVRTFFFVVFGITISLASLVKLKVVLISLIIVAIIYAFRFALFKLLMQKSDNNLILLSPRGLITILLYYAIPDDFKIAEFEDGILLFVILFSSVIMTFSLLKEKHDQDHKSKAINDDKQNSADYEVVPVEDN